jgi:predicted component of type VI protein secretion system
VDKVKQDIIHILKCVKSSDAFHPDYGVDWLKIKQSGYNRLLIEHEIRKAIANYDRIKSIDRIDSEPDSNRNVKIKLYITLDSGKMDVEVVV